MTNKPDPNHVNLRNLVPLTYAGLHYHWGYTANHAPNMAILTPGYWADASIHFRPGDFLFVHYTVPVDSNAIYAVRAGTGGPKLTTLVPATV